MHNLHAIFPKGRPTAHQKLDAIRSVRAARELIIKRTAMEPPEDFVNAHAISRLLASDRGVGYTWVAAADSLADIQEAAALLERSGYFTAALDAAPVDLERAAAERTPEAHPDPAEAPAASETISEGFVMVKHSAKYPPGAYKKAMVLLVQAEGNPVTAAATAYHLGMIDAQDDWRKAQGTIFEVFPWALGLVQKSGLLL